MTAILPYETPAGEIAMTFAAVRIDGRTLDRPEGRELDLGIVGVVDWQRIDLELDIVAPFDLARVEGGLRVVASCDATNLRFGATPVASRLDPSRSRCSLALHRDAVAEATELRAILYGSVDGRPGRLLRESEPLVVLPDAESERERRLEGYMAVKWVSFSSSEMPELARFSDEMFFPALDQEPPVLYLNRDFRNLHGLLMDRQGRSGVAKAMHDAVRSAVAAKTWIALMNSAVASLAETDPGEDVAPPAGWRGQVVRRLIARAYPGETEADALRRLMDARRTNGGASLQPIIVMVAEQLAKAGQLLRLGMRALSHDDLSASHAHELGEEAA